MKVSINYSENLHFVAKARQFSDIQLDEPESFYGTDIGPSSVEYFLIGIGGCIGSTLAHSFHLKKMEIQDLDVIVDGILKHVGPNLRLRLIKVDVEINYSLITGYKEQDIEDCIQQFQDFCVINNSLMNSFPIDLKIKRKEKED